MTRPKKTDAEKRADAKAKLLESLNRKPSPFNIELAPRDTAKQHKFTSGIFRSN